MQVMFVMVCTISTKKKRNGSFRSKSQKSQQLWVSISHSRICQLFLNNNNKKELILWVGVHINQPWFNSNQRFTIQRGHNLIWVYNLRFKSKAIQFKMLWDSIKKRFIINYNGEELNACSFFIFFFLQNGMKIAGIIGPLKYINPVKFQLNICKGFTAIIFFSNFPHTLCLRQR